MALRPDGQMIVQEDRTVETNLDMSLGGDGWQPLSEDSERSGWFVALSNVGRIEGVRCFLELIGLRKSELRRESSTFRSEVRVPGCKNTGM